MQYKSLLMQYSPDKKELAILRLLTRVAKNLYNVGLYNVRQAFFNKEKFINYYDNDKLCQSNHNYKLLNSAFSQRILQTINENFSSFFALLKKGDHPQIPRYLKKDSYFTLSTQNIRITNKGRQRYYVLPLFNFMRTLAFYNLTRDDKTIAKELDKLIKYKDESLKKFLLYLEERK